MTANTARASTVPAPRGKPGGPGLFRLKGQGLPPYIQHVRNALMRSGTPESRATQMAIGIVRNWAVGRDGKGGRVSAEVQAAAVKAVAAYNASRAKAKAIPNRRSSVGLARADISSRSGMIALEVPEGTLPHVAGGVPDQHVTLAFLGDDVNDAALNKAKQVAAAAANRHGPLAGVLGGIGAFPAGDDGVPVWATVDVPGLAELRHGVVADLGGTASEHGYTPHVTLTYLERGQSLPEPLPPTKVRFTHISVHCGDDVTRFPLTAGSDSPAVTLAATATTTGPKKRRRLPVFKLPFGRKKAADKKAPETGADLEAMIAKLRKSKPGLTDRQYMALAKAALARGRGPKGPASKVPPAPADTRLAASERRYAIVDLSTGQTVTVVDLAPSTVTTKHADSKPARKAKKAKKAKPGTGARFQALRDELARRGAANPDALAAAIGRKKYGKAGMAKLAKGSGAKARKSA